MEAAVVSQRVEAMVGNQSKWIRQDGAALPKLCSYSLGGLSLEKATRNQQAIGLVGQDILPHSV